MQRAYLLHTLHNKTYGKNWTCSNNKSIFLPLNGQHGGKIILESLYSSSNLVVARSTRAGGTSFLMQFINDEIKLIRLLLARLERVSVDSYWAHRASGIRVGLLRTLEELEKGTPVGQANTDELISSAFNILTRAAREKR